MKRFGEENSTPPPAPVFQPIVDKVGVPLLWFAIGYAVCKFTGNKKA